MRDFNEQEETIRQAIAGDKDALGRLLQANHEYIYKMAYIYTGNKQDALDILQEAAAQSVRAIRTLREPQFFLTWFCKIMIRQTGKLFKNRQHEVFIEEPSDWGSQENGGTQLGVSVDLLKAVLSLEDRYRVVVQLYYYQDFSIREISRLLQMKEGTVKTNLSRGREQLRQILGDDYVDKSV